MFDLPPPEHTRGFFDPIKTRKWIQEYALEGFNHALNKIESPDFKLKVSKIEFPEADKHFTLKDQKQAIMEKKSLTLPIKGLFQLINKTTGQVVDEKHTTIAHVPYITDRNTALLSGTEFLVANQARLKPGVYTRIKQTGEAEAHVNVKMGTGVGGKLEFNAEKGLFVYVVGTMQIKLYGLLHDLGVTDAEMEQAWGKEILLKNKQTYDGGELEKFYSKIFRFG